MRWLQFDMAQRHTKRTCGEKKGVEWISWPSPTCSPHASDDEADVDVEADEANTMEVAAVKGGEEEVVEYGV